MESRKQSLLIVENDPQQAELLRVVLASHPAYHLIGIFPTATESIAALKKQPADIAIVDLDLDNGESGLDVIRFGVDAYPEMLILVHTIYEDSTTLFEALKAGAGGYILKGATPVEMFQYVEQLKNGEVPMSPKIARRIIAFFRGDSLCSDCLTEREIEVLELADKGYTYKQIAEKSHISRHTVHTHFKNIYQKLQVNTKEEAVRKAKKLTLL